MAALPLLHNNAIGHLLVAAEEGASPLSLPGLRFASPDEMLERVSSDSEVLIVAVLDDLSFDVIKAFGNCPPRGYHEWISTTATRRIRKLAFALIGDTGLESRNSRGTRPNAIRQRLRRVAASWLLPQMERKFGELPCEVRRVLDQALHH